jgi:hypothetical protein
MFIGINSGNYQYSPTTEFLHFENEYTLSPDFVADNQLVGVPSIKNKNCQQFVKNTLPEYFKISQYYNT